MLDTQADSAANPSGLVDQPLASSIPPGVGMDLSAGELPAVASGLDRLALEEHNHRLSLQRDLYSMVIAFVVILYIAALLLGVYVLERIFGKQADWHVSLLVATFIVTPTVLLLSLLKVVYNKTASKEDSSVPLLNLVKECVSAAKDAFK